MLAMRNFGKRRRNARECTIYACLGTSEILSLLENMTRAVQVFQVNTDVVTNVFAFQLEVSAVLLGFLPQKRDV